MAKTPQLFVDDVVRGDLPRVCVLSGEPSEGHVEIEVRTALSGGWLWFALLLGPVGIGLIVLFLMLGSTMLVRLPMTERSIDRYCDSRRQIWWAGIAFIMWAIAGVGFVQWADRTNGLLRQLAVGLFVVGLIAIVVRILAFQWTITVTQLRVRLDASRRWVTIDNVNPAFARACQLGDRYQNT
ncbi:MAG: hypothetical protein GY708_19480 [Actinomycetia bacterium]|nr:hypothetical protein [Actinomycetes bacterium]